MLFLKFYVDMNMNKYAYATMAICMVPIAQRIFPPNQSCHVRSFLNFHVGIVQCLAVNLATDYVVLL
jgi:hypothetical protein